MNYPIIASPHQGYTPLHPMAAPSMDLISAAAYGGSLPGPEKTLEQAHQENLIKYRKLKARYMEMELVSTYSYFKFPFPLSLLEMERDISSTGHVAPAERAPKG